MAKQNKLSKIIEYGLYLLIFLLPWQARMIYKAGELVGGFWEYGTFALYGTEVLLLALVLLNIFDLIKKTRKHPPAKAMALRAGKNTKTRSRLQKLFSCFLVFLFILICMSIFWAQDSGLALFRFGVILEGFMLFWLIVTSRASYRKLAWAIVLSGAMQAGLGIWQFLGQEVVGNKWLGMADQIPMDGGVSVVETVLRRWLRVYGSLPHPNILGGWLVIGLVLCMGLYENVYRRLSVGWGDANDTNRLDSVFVMVLLLCYIVMLFGLFCTFSRGAWIAFFIGLSV